MVDRRIVPDLRWIAQRYPIYITDGFSGRLPDGEHVGCRGCHVEHSDHLNGLAVDIVPLNGDGRCDRTWRGDHPPRPLGGAAPEPAAAAVPVGRVRRRCRPRLRQPSAPLLVPRPGAAVTARRMGRSLPGRLPGRGPAARRTAARASGRAPAAPRRDLDGPLGRPLASRRLRHAAAPRMRLADAPTRSSALAPDRARPRAARPAARAMRGRPSPASKARRPTCRRSRTRRNRSGFRAGPGSATA